MLQFKVDTEKCIQCGECADDCFFGIIGMEEYPVVLNGKEELCIGCQHCLAVCPTGAVSVFGKDPEESLPLMGGLPSPQQMETLIMGRRSTRRYKKEGVDPEIIHHLLHVTSHAPTAVNQRNTVLTVVDDAEAMDRFRREVTEASLKAVREGRIPAGLERIEEYIRRCEDGSDVIFRNAPHLLVASAPPDTMAPMADCHIAMSYFELLANSHGLGTVWNGIARAILSSVLPEYALRLGIPADHQIVCVMSFGRPAVKYHRTVQRPGGVIRRADL